MKCYACGRDYSEEFEFCPFCGSYPIMFCPNCLGDFKEGEKICSECGGELLPISKLKHFHELQAKAFEYREKDDYEKSNEYYEKMLEELPNLEDVHYILAENYELMGNNEKALEMYEKLSRLNPRYVGVWARIGRAYIAKEDLVNARKYLLKEHKINPTENEHYIYSMHICFLEDEFEKANRILDDLFAIGPNEFDLRAFKKNNDLNLEMVEYNQELADINERIKEYIKSHFD